MGVCDVPVISSVCSAAGDAAASLVTAGVVLFTRRRIAFLAAAGLAASAAAGFILSRTTGLPNAHGDIGNWTEPLGLASLFVEGAVVAVATTAYGLVPARRQVFAERRPGVGASAGPVWN